MLILIFIPNTLKQKKGSKTIVTGFTPLKKNYLTDVFIIQVR